MVAYPGLFISMCLLCCYVSGSKLICKDYQHVNKENIRNCLEELFRNKQRERDLLEQVSRVANLSVSKPNSLTEEFIDRVLSASDRSELKGSDERNETIEDTKKVSVELTEGVTLNMEKVNDTSITLSVTTSNQTALARKMKDTMHKLLPYLIIPGLIMSGILPWILPQIKMMAMTVSMINQMAFTSALFAFIRSYIFDTEHEEHIVYVNHGYKNKLKHIHEHYYR